MSISTLINKDELLNCVSLINKHKIPSPPKTLLDLRSEVLSAAPDMKLIFELIHSDIGLSSSILKVVNSSQFNLPEKVTSIEHAIKLLGISKLKEAIIQPAYRLAISQSIEGFDDISNHSHYVGVIADIISRFVAFDYELDRSMFYLAGLFHDVGVIVLSLEYSDYWDFYLKNESNPLSMLGNELEKYGVSHVSIGVLLAKKWGLPAEVCDAIYLHHHVYDSYKIEASYKSITITEILKLAHSLNYFFEHSDDESNTEYWLMQNSAIEELLLDDEQINQIKQDVRYL